MEYIETALGALLREKAHQFPDRDFIIYSDRNLRFTYGEFDRRVDDLAKGLLSIGIGRGDHVGKSRNSSTPWKRFGTFKWWGLPA